MKSIEDTLRLISSIVDSVSRGNVINIALVGGYAVIAHGVERTTADVDFCVYTDIISRNGAQAFAGFLRDAIPDNFEIKFVEGTKMIDPFKHDIIFLNDRGGEYPRIDFIIAKYRWELEGIRSAMPLEDIPFPVLPKPYLIAMKLKAGGIKDDYDVVGLYGLLTEEEKMKTHELAKLIRMDKKLMKLIKPKKVKREREDKSQLI